MSEAEKSEEIPTVPTFELAPGGIQMFVTIPKDQVGKWVKKLGAPFNQRKKAYTFLTEQIELVEQYLGLEKGSSGIKDPKHHYAIELHGTVHGDSFADLKKTLEENGVTWSKQKNCFVGATKSYEVISKNFVK